MRFFEKQVFEQINEVLEDRLFAYDQQIADRLDTLLGSAAEVIQGTIKLAPEREYKLIDAESDSFSRLEGVFDLSELTGGQIVQLEIDLRMPGGRLVRWGTPQYEGGVISEPGMAFGPLLCPAGVKITARHAAGSAFLLHYFLVRRGDA